MNSNSMLASVPMFPGVLLHPRPPMGREGEYIAETRSSTCQVALTIYFILLGERGVGVGWRGTLGVKCFPRIQHRL